MTTAINKKCPGCKTGDMQTIPFETDEGESVFCDVCGYTEKQETELVTDRSPALKYPMMPRHTNQYGTVFGGIILSLIDQAAFIESRKHGLHRWVTASFNQVDFLKPVRVGDTVSLYTETLREGSSSVQVEVKVEVERYDDGTTEHVCSAKVTMVSVGPDGRPIPFASPPSIKWKT